MIVTIPGIAYPISICSIKDYQAIGGPVADQSISTMMQAGGYCVIVLTQEQIDSILSSDIDEAWKTDFRVLQPGPVVNVLKDIDEKMSFDESMAILYHECGHIHYEHHKLAPKAVPGEVTFLINQQAEIEADAYALQFTEKAVLRSAILKAMQISVRFAAIAAELPFDEVWEDALEESAERLAALAD